MTVCAWIRWSELWLSVVAASVIAGQPSAPGFAPGEAICGYAGSFQRIEAGTRREGLAVELLAGDAVAKVPLALRFRIVEKPLDRPVEDLQVEHEKHLHVIGVREDLGELVHIHPLRAAPGLWELEHVFTNAGRYRFWTDVKYRGTVYSFGQPPLVVAGESLPAKFPLRSSQLEARVGDYRLRLESAEPSVLVGRTNQFAISVVNAQAEPVSTEFFLGALMHLIVVSADLKHYTHAHAEEHLKSAAPVTFRHVFPSPGFYKLFAQFRPLDSKLPPEQALLAEFWLRVDSPAKP